MRFMGFEISRSKALTPISSTRNGWVSIVRDWFTGAWQRNLEISHDEVLAYHAVFACMTLIASDISKLPVRFIKLQKGVWQESKSATYDPVLRKPNPYQTRIQFWESWILSKLGRGNTYVLKGRDERGNIVRMHVLDPMRTRAMVTDGGDVWYELQPDNLSSQRAQVMVPASEIIHDRFNCLFHPLVGVPPLYANSVAASQGLKIQESAAHLFGNRGIPGGVLTAPGNIPDAQLQRLKEEWRQGFTGKNAGMTAILSDGMKFETLTMKAVDAQLTEQLKLTAEIVCSTFHVPPYKIGIGSVPTRDNLQALNVEYYSQCLQALIEQAELCLDEGLALKPDVGVEFYVKNLLRMDTVSQISAIKEAVGAGVMAPNEGRAEINLPPVPGGDSPMMQQQNYSLEALAERDSDKPFAKPVAATPSNTPAGPMDEDDPDEDEEDDDNEQRSIEAEAILKDLERRAKAFA